MRKCLMTFSRIVECGAVKKCVHLVDLVKSFQNCIYYLLAKIGVDTVENELHLNPNRVRVLRVQLRVITRKQLIA